MRRHELQLYGTGHGRESPIRTLLWRARAQPEVEYHGSYNYSRVSRHRFHITSVLVPIHDFEGILVGRLDTLAGHHALPWVASSKCLGREHWVRGSCMEC